MTAGDPRQMDFGHVLSSYLLFSIIMVPKFSSYLILELKIKKQDKLYNQTLKIF